MKDCWPFGVALRGVASNRLMLRWLKTVVVSDEEKASWRRQVGIGKASASESLLKCRNWFEMASELGRVRGSRMSLADTRLLARRCPACRRREPDLRLSRGTWEGRPRYCYPFGRVCERECSKRLKP
jgi:hypothetical protein